ncbi:MAG: UTP--glucose-1-phosphate uridylyltransferase [Geminicoccus sp.]|nr:UTP--glucose-1-phosphate uridylyltransferase [Geminicoccus sp.]
MEPNPIRKAVFPVAGLGTRFLPATKAIPKAMLPIIDRPLIDFAVREAIASGIDTLIFITGRQERAIADHFDRNVELEFALAAKGQHEALEATRQPLPKNVKCFFVRQHAPEGLGYAVLQAQRIIGNEPFAVLLPDDYLPEGQTTTALIERYRATGQSQIAVQEITGPEISDFSVVIPGNTPSAVAGLTNKPALEEAPSTLAGLGRCVLSPEILGILASLGPGQGGEVQLSDALNLLARTEGLGSVIIEEPWFDCGSKQGYAAALSDAITQKRWLNGWLKRPQPKDEQHRKRDNFSTAL